MKPIVTRLLRIAVFSVIIIDIVGFGFLTEKLIISSNHPEVKKMPVPQYFLPALKLHIAPTFLRSAWEELPPMTVRLSENPPDDLRININNASIKQLQVIPGIGKVLAERIINKRIEEGDYCSVDDLLDVAGIGPGKMDKIRNWVTVGIESRGG